ncbi:hypothetical protein [Halodesulfovibrio sp. MK-HDV]|uniref:hypothetical protein n=1 Tax=Halodesulfovibrio sp. MK-HDV TaxID=2599925 RepID=UPI00136F997F|nr:hypothetical protein [Halodesulfovibrio sp. MK-HDV]
MHSTHLRQTTSKLAKEKQRAFKRFFATKVLAPEILVSEVRRREVLKVWHILTTQHSRKNVDRQVKNLKTGWNWGIDFLEMPKANPFYRLPVASTEEEVTLYAAVRRHACGLKLAAKSDNSEHNIVLFSFLTTGARRVELRRLTWDDIKFLAEEFSLRTKKRRNRIEGCYFIPLAEELAPPT